MDTALGRITDLDRAAPRDFVQDFIRRNSGAKERLYLKGLHKTGTWVTLCEIEEDDVKQVMRDCTYKQQPFPSRVSINFNDFSAFKTERAIRIEFIE